MVPVPVPNPEGAELVVGVARTEVPSSETVVSGAGTRLEVGETVRTT